MMVVNPDMITEPDNVHVKIPRCLEEGDFRLGRLYRERCTYTQLDTDFGSTWIFSDMPQYTGRPGELLMFPVAPEDYDLFEAEFCTYMATDMPALVNDCTFLAM